MLGNQLALYVHPDFLKKQTFLLPPTRPIEDQPKSNEKYKLFQSYTNFIIAIA